MWKEGSFCLFLTLMVLTQALTPTSYYTKDDRRKLKAKFEEGFGSDLESIYYSILGFSLLGEDFENSVELCEKVQSNVESSNTDSVFYAVSSAKLLKECQLNVEDSVSALQAALSDSPAEQIYHAVASLVNLNQAVDADAVMKSIDAALKKDDAPLSHGYAFLAASYLSGDLTSYYELIEDVVAQADEIENKYLQFEAGLFTTAVVLDGAFRLSQTVDKKPSISADKIDKFAAYLMSRKHVQSIKIAASVLSAAKTLSTNDHHVPTAVTLDSAVAVSEDAPFVKVRVSNLMGENVDIKSVIADTALNLGEDAIILSKKPFVKSDLDESVFELNLMDAKPARGFYKLKLNVDSENAEIDVKVTSTVSTESVEVSIVDKDSSSAVRTVLLHHPIKAVNVLQVDNHQKIIMQFQIKDQATKELLTVHQVFIRFSSLSGQEIIFVAEPDASQTYKFDLDIGANAKDFAYISGQYTMALIIGDAVIENPSIWELVDIEFKFQDAPLSKNNNEYTHLPLPEIKHLFREPEIRPSLTVSNIFTVLTIAPILLLLILWIVLGVNLKNFSFSISCIGFHLGLGGIFGVYVLYWTQLNMFTTMKYVSILAIPTFLFGNRLLSSIAAKRK